MIKIEFESKALDRAISLLKDINLNSNLKWSTPVGQILNGVRIYADDMDTNRISRIRLYVTNLEISAEIEVVGEVIDKGEIVVDKKTFLDFTKMNSRISVHLLKDDQVEIIGDGARSIKLLNIMVDKDYYPNVIPDQQGEILAKCSAEALCDLLEKTIFAADKEEDGAHHEVQNVCLHFLANSNGRNVRAIATDGKILALVTEYRLSRSDAMDMDRDERKFLIPRKSAEILMRTLKRLKQATVTMIFHPDEQNPENNRMLFEVNGIKIVSRLTDAEYPNYEQIIPPDKDRFEFAANTTELLKALKNISILVPKSRMVILQVEGDLMKISTKSDLGAAQETVAIKRDPLLKEKDKSDSPAPSMMAFSVDLLTNILNHIEAKGVVMSLDMNKAESIAIIKPNDSLGYLYLLMPMRLQ